MHAKVYSQLKMVKLSGEIDVVMMDKNAFRVWIMRSVLWNEK